jgi:hypothetical protein
MMNATARNSSPKLSAGNVLRVVTMLALVAIIWGGPFYRQVLHGREPWLRPWVMFSGAGLTATELRMWQVLPDGSTRRVDRYELLAPRRDPPPHSLAHVADEAQAQAIARRVCKRLAPGADVRMRFRVATRRGWRTRIHGDVNWCTAPLPGPTGSSPAPAIPAAAVPPAVAPTTDLRYGPT